MKRCLPFRILMLACFFLASAAKAQLVSGPMLGPVELRTAKLWIEVKPGSSADLWYWKKGEQGKAIRLVKKTANKSRWFFHDKRTVAVA
ncbi:MAG: hypothetical protein GXC73_19805 [Chitinophagaceae bacterium]|nr:hypothetical protein [Chitinophagaceae bacterium]